MIKKLHTILLLCLITSCNKKSLFLGYENEAVSLSIIQDELNPSDDIQVSLEPLLTSSESPALGTYVKSIYTLSKRTDSVSVEISGKYLDSLTSKDITDLASVGITGISLGSTKSNLIDFSKNIAVDPNLAYNIKVESFLYDDSDYQNLIVSSTPAYIYVADDNHYDGEFITPVKAENYYLFHEWDTNQLSAIEKLPEGNFRKVSLGTTTGKKFDFFTFAKNYPKVNGFQVGYSIDRDTRIAYKVTNDGSGLFGWNFTSMSTLPYYSSFTDQIGTENSEPVFLSGAYGGGGPYSNTSFEIVRWDGAKWISSFFGTGIKNSVGGTWNNSFTYKSKTYGHSDGTFWLALKEGNAVIDNSDQKRIVDSKAVYMMRLEYNSGAFDDEASWSKELISVPSVQDAIKSEINDILITTYSDINNFTAFFLGDGFGKVVRTNGVTEFIPIASNASALYYDKFADFPKGLDANGLQKMQPMKKMSLDAEDSNLILLQGYTSIVEYNIKENKLTEVLGIKDGGSVTYSR